MSTPSIPESRDPKNRIEELEALLDRLAENLNRVQRKLKEVSELLDLNEEEPAGEQRSPSEKDSFSQFDLSWLSTAI